MSTVPESNGTTIADTTASAISSPPAKRIKTTTADDDTDMAVESAPVPPAAAAAAVPALQVKKLSDKARLPTRGSAFAAGYDVYAARDTVVPARGKVLVDTDISIAVPAGTCTLPSSLLSPCLAFKKAIVMLAE